MPFRGWSIATCVVVLAGLVPSSAAAQSFGLGPRLSFVGSELPGSAPRTRFLGGTVRLRSSKLVALEAALDYRSAFSEDGRTRFRQTPFQASLLLFPVRAVFSPYLLGGMGIYTEHADRLGPTGAVLETTSTRQTGWHLGGGAELFVMRHAALFMDYRFRFVRFGTPDPEAEPINIPGLGGLKLSHRGSMWTSGMAFYF